MDHKENSRRSSCTWPRAASWSSSLTGFSGAATLISDSRNVFIGAHSSTQVYMVDFERFRSREFTKLGSRSYIAQSGGPYVYFSSTVNGRTSSVHTRNRGRLLTPNLQGFFTFAKVSSFRGPTGSLTGPLSLGGSSFPAFYRGNRSGKAR